MRQMFYKPANGWVGDIIPFFKDGEYKLFYIHDFRNNPPCDGSLPWYLLGTKNFVDFTEYGEAIPCGNKTEQDAWVCTGSVIETDGLYHIFYTGMMNVPEHMPQAVMHAVSKDFVNWRKHPEDTFFADTSLYEKFDWRDPFVFYNDEEKCWNMLVTAKCKSGLDSRTGCIALLKSRDLRKWENKGPFYYPGCYAALECPDLFKIGEWWYLVFSTFNGRTCTRYRMSKSLNGPWFQPAVDTFDTRAFYAAKTASDGKRRFIFGWNPPRGAEGNESDDEPWNWAGNIVVHEIKQNPDGTLRVSMPDEIFREMDSEKAIRCRPAAGKWTCYEGKYSGDAGESYACILSEEPMADNCMITADFSFSSDSTALGMLIRTDNSLKKGYLLSVRPKKSRITFGKFPEAWCEPHPFSMERTAEIKENQSHTLKVLIRESIAAFYLDDQAALSVRMFQYKDGLLGFFAENGKVVFSNIKQYKFIDNGEIL